MSEHEEFKLRRIKSLWQSRQDTAGVVALFLGCLTLGICLAFLSAPSWQLAGVMGCLVVLLVVSCWRLLSSAARVVEIGKRLGQFRFDCRFQPEIIGSEGADALAQQAMLN